MLGYRRELCDVLVQRDPMSSSTVFISKPRFEPARVSVVSAVITRVLASSDLRQATSLHKSARRYLPLFCAVATMGLARDLSYEGFKKWLEVYFLYGMAGAGCS